MTIHQTTSLTAVLEGAENTFEADKFARVIWACVSEPGDLVRGRLIAERGAADALQHILDADEDDLEVDAFELRERVNRPFTADQLVHILERTEHFGASIITPGHPHWPAGLNDLGDAAPTCLWVRGDNSLFSLPAIAIVGARACTGYGEHVTIDITTDLTKSGWTIVSGAAYGIDGLAHRAALAGTGRTIAVLAGGVDRFYPSGHDALLQRIVESGAVVSEIPIGAAPTKWRFLQRNRIIAAIAEKTVVIEAGHRSGSLNTAGHALAIGRPTGAVPGPVNSATSAGCHRLIREKGAVLITNAQDVEDL